MYVFTKYIYVCITNLFYVCIYLYIYIYIYIYIYAFTKVLIKTELKGIWLFHVYSYSLV